ncbi:MAG TPA: thioredoxin [Clostridiales bacterium]|nr:thioredoxin [Clostridiales bacterium]
MAVLHLTNEDFDETIAEGTVLVDFWASWCGPCRMFSPTIESLAEKYEGKAKICKVDVDAEPELARRFGVMSIPTIIVFRDGTETSKRVGVQPMAELEKMLEG